MPRTKQSILDRLRLLSDVVGAIPPEEFDGLPAEHLPVTLIGEIRAIVESCPVTEWL